MMIVICHLFVLGSLCVYHLHLQASLTNEKEKKVQAKKRCDDLDKSLKETLNSLDSKSAEQEATAATLSDTQKQLEKEKTAGAALGEQVIDLSKQVEQQTARATKAEDVSSQLQKGLLSNS